MTDDSAHDDLLERARELQEKAGPSQSDRKSPVPGKTRWPPAGLRRISERFSAVRRYLGPLGSLIAWVTGWIGRWFRWAAFRMPDREDATSSDMQFSGARLLLNTMLSAAALVLLHMAISAAYYYGTAFEETVYVTGKQEIETGELYQFGGCTSLPCSTEADNGKFYLIESSLYFPKMYYPEENVFANIPQQDAACYVRGYGWYFRTLRWLYKSAQLYQHVTDVSCRPYTEEEIERAVGEGRIQQVTPSG